MRRSPTRGFMGSKATVSTFAESVTRLLDPMAAATADSFFALVAGLGIGFLASFFEEQRLWLMLIGGGILIFLGLRLFFNNILETVPSQTEQKRFYRRFCISLFSHPFQSAHHYFFRSNISRLERFICWSLARIMGNRRNIYRSNDLVGDSYNACTCIPRQIQSPPLGDAQQNRWSHHRRIRRIRPHFASVLTDVLDRIFNIHKTSFHFDDVAISIHGNLSR